MTDPVDRPWTRPMPNEQFDFMRRVLAAPSPVGLEAAMTHGVLQPEMERYALPGWAVHRFRGNAGIVLDTHPGRTDLLTVMVVGHADKIRLQVRSIGEDGKVWVDSDSFLPCTLLGHEVQLFSEDPENPGRYRIIEGGTIEAIGAIHYSDAAIRAGDRGVRPNQLYLDLQIHGESRRDQIQRLGVRAGDTLLLHRPIRRGFAPDSFVGAYLDNGLGCFVAAEVGRLIAARGGFTNVRTLLAAATHEEIGRMGSRVLAAELRPDVVFGVDVAHDFEAAPGVGDRRYTPTAMGRGFTFTAGAVVSEYLNSLVEQASRARGIPAQRVVVGRDTGTDAMSAVFANIDAACTSVGMPVRNMHTISETGHTGDVLAAIHAVFATIAHMDSPPSGAPITREDFRTNHPRLDLVQPLAHRGGTAKRSDSSAAERPLSGTEENS